MEIRKASIYDKFNCIADKCPENCCKGWRIHIDDDTVQKYLEMKGLKGVCIRLFMHTDDFMPYFSKKSIRCPLMTHDRYCSIQRRIGEDFMPEICRRFPRDMRNYGAFAEYHLDLSCTHAAFLMLENRDAEKLIISEGTSDLPVFGNNDDEDFLKTLDESRREMLSLFEYSKGFGIDGLDNAFKRALDIATSDHFRALSVQNPESVKNTGTGLFPLPLEILNEMVNNSLYKDRMLYYSPFFYSLFRRYFKYFDSLTPAKGKHRYRAYLEAFINGYPDIIPHMYEYVRYSIEREYLTTFEDYSFIKRILDTLLCANVILLLETVYFTRHKQMSMQTEARIISLCERRARHNDYILKKLSDTFKLDTDMFRRDLSPNFTPKPHQEPSSE